ncbi:MAG: DegV family protein, partial [Chloroflexi bacterium]|nr:DegV family protein [Chloroflexota bacterium]
EAYESLVEEGHDEIVSIHMTSKGSGAYQAALVAQSMIKEKEPAVHVEVIDTRNVLALPGLDGD